MFLSMAFGLALLSAATSPSDAKPGPTLGCDPDTVIEHYGVPDSVLFSSMTLTFAYRGENQKPRLVVFHQGVAISVPAATFKPAKPVKPPADRVYNGQAAATAAIRLGNPESFTHGVGSTVAHYASGADVTFVHGRVLIE